MGDRTGVNATDVYARAAELRESVERDRAERAAHPSERPCDPTNYLTQFGNEVRAFRLAQRLTQDELARITGMSRCNVSNIEAGRGNVTIARLLRIAAALECTPADLLPTPLVVEDSARNDGEG